MSDLPKLLGPIETTVDLDWSWTESSVGTVTATLSAGRWDTIIELLVELNVECLALTGDTAIWTVNSNGFCDFEVADIPCSPNWGGCDSALLAILGFAGTETFSGDNLTATKRHLYGWYSPVGVEYPGIRRRMTRRVQKNDAGGVFVWASSAVHKDLDLFFSPLLEAQIEPGSATTEADGKGGTVDWTDRTFYDFWEHIAGSKFRFYEDGELGTVATPGTEGTDYLVCVRTDDESEPMQIDPDGYEWFSVDLPVHIDTENL